MFIFPWTVEDARIRDFPTATLAFFVVCMLTFVASEVSPFGPDLGDVLEEWAKPIQDEHVLLTMPDACMGSQELRETLTAVVAHLRETGEFRQASKADDARLADLCAQMLRVQKHDPVYQLSFVPSRGIVQVGWVTYMFLHADWAHLFGNLFILFFLCGPFLEDRWGTPRFASLYMAGGVMAALAHHLADPTSTVPLVGASGAIAAIMGAFCVRFALRKVVFVPILFPFIPLPRLRVQVPAVVVGGLWFAWSIWQQLSDDGTGISHMAHIGGFALGAAAAFAGSAARWPEVRDHAAGAAPPRGLTVGVMASPIVAVVAVAILKPEPTWRHRSDVSTPGVAGTTIEQLAEADPTPPDLPPHVVLHLSLSSEGHPPATTLAFALSRTIAVTSRTAWDGLVHHARGGSDVHGKVFSAATGEPLGLVETSRIHHDLTFVHLRAGAALEPLELAAPAVGERVWLVVDDHTLVPARVTVLEGGAFRIEGPGAPIGAAIVNQQSACVGFVTATVDGALVGVGVREILAAATSSP